MAHNPRTSINLITTGKHCQALDLVILAIIRLTWLVATPRIYSHVASLHHQLRVGETLRDHS